MNAAGQLAVRGRLVGGRLCDLAVDLQRPSVTRLFIGQLPEAVVKTVPYLFTLCAHAQRAAAQAALASAQGLPRRESDPVVLWEEVLHENLWRLLLDWPTALGEAPARDAFINWRNARHTVDGVAATEALWREVSPRLFEFGAIFGIPRQSMPATADQLDPAAWLAFWRGESEIMPAPVCPPTIGSAFRTRLDEVERAIAALRDGTPFPVAAQGEDGWGIGQTLTARGVLTHAVHVAEGVVARYRVQAPTDSLFANADGLTKLLAGHEFSGLDQARQALDQAILALDPCLPYTVELHDA